MSLRVARRTQRAAELSRGAVPGLPMPTGRVQPWLDKARRSGGRLTAPIISASIARSRRKSSSSRASKGRLYSGAEQISSSQNSKTQKLENQKTRELRSEDVLDARTETLVSYAACAA